MDITIYPGQLNGSVDIIPSKSQAHRMLICAALADRCTSIDCAATNQDIEATARCLNALGARINRTKTGYEISPIDTIPDTAVLDCGESGSTLRFLLPLVGSIGVDTTFLPSGRLPSRPLSPLWEEMERMGCQLTRPTASTIRCQGKLTSGHYTIDGGVSSQFITGLLFAMTQLSGERSLTVTGTIESAPYIRLSEHAMACFGVDTGNYCFADDVQFHSPEQISIEGDWSNAAFFLCANHLGNRICVHGLNRDSVQGDRTISQILQNADIPLCVDGKDIPDLIPILSVLAGAKQGGTFYNIGRLRSKESDRVDAVCKMLAAFGIRTQVDGDTLQVFPGKYHGCIVDSCNDHRIAMSAAIAATTADGPVTILNAECVQKSYPDFWLEYKRLGGNYE